MTLAVTFRPQALAEADDSRRWYEDQAPGLGARFAEAIAETVERITLNPFAYPLVHGQIRRAVARRFPFSIYFRVDTTEVVILAVMHGRRHPRQWQSRR